MVFPHTRGGQSTVAHRPGISARTRPHAWGSIRVPAGIAYRPPAPTRGGQSWESGRSEPKEPPHLYTWGSLVLPGQSDHHPVVPSLHVEVSPWSGYCSASCWSPVLTREGQSMIGGPLKACSSLALTREGRQSSTSATIEVPTSPHPLHMRSVLDHEAPVVVEPAQSPSALTPSPPRDRPAPPLACHPH